jgi:hypothetical protein
MREKKDITDIYIGSQCGHEFCHVCYAPYAGLEGIHHIGNDAHDPKCVHHSNNLGNYVGDIEDDDESDDEDEEEMPAPPELPMKKTSNNKRKPGTDDEAVDNHSSTHERGEKRNKGAGDETQEPLAQPDDTPITPLVSGALNHDGGIPNSNHRRVPRRPQPPANRLWKIPFYY